jgi:hypothetical protein
MNGRAPTIVRQRRDAAHSVSCDVRRCASGVHDGRSDRCTPHRVTYPSGRPGCPTTDGECSGLAAPPSPAAGACVIAFPVELKGSSPNMY